jgi:ADP-heptose:LPS heptosyltransferase
MARGAQDRGKRIAFGDGKKIIWDQHSREIFRKNKNIAIPRTEHQSDVEWIPFYKGNRLYNKFAGNRWIWNLDFRAIPGEIVFDKEEIDFSKRIKPGFILIEPNVPWHKSVAPNKDWGKAKYQAAANELISRGYEVAQFSFGQVRLSGVRVIPVSSFREAAIALTRSRMAILPEGGLHHGAAAVGVRAVVLFGGFIPPVVTGYPGHTNLNGGFEACGSIFKCDHCRAAMEAISVESVINATEEILRGRHDATAGSVLQSSAESSRA